MSEGDKRNSLSPQNGAGLSHARTITHTHARAYTHTTCCWCVCFSCCPGLSIPGVARAACSSFGSFFHKDTCAQTRRHTHAKMCMQTYILTNSCSIVFSNIFLLLLFDRYYFEAQQRPGTTFFGKRKIFLFQLCQ